jgi:DNA recombination protein RmuC
MEVSLIILGILILIALGLILFILKQSVRNKGSEDIIILNSRIEELNTLNKVAEANENNLRQNVSALGMQVKEKDERILDISRQLSVKETEITGLEKKLQDKRAEIEQSEEKLRTAFKNLANEILEEKTLKFTEQNKIKLDELLKPLGEKIKDFEKKVDETYDKESKQRFSLEKEIKNLADLNQQISKEANNLTNALKGQSKTRGNWGEIILESILEKSGLVKDREYYIQSSFTDEHGKRFQPDVIVVYPGERNLIIDSKVSLNAYERFASAETKEEQDAAIRDHLLSVRNHIQELSSKNYQDIYQLKGLDFVMMFMPVEPAYFIAMQNDPDLWNYAYERRILLISPTNLIAALKMIANLWRVEYQNKFAQDIADQSGALYDKFADFVKDLMAIGEKIDATKNVYDISMNKLTTGKGNLIRRAEKIKALGAKTGKEIPKSLLDKANEDEI